MDTRIMPCPKCGGDKGFDVPHDIDRNNGDMVCHWVECRYCGGEGDEEIELEPITMEDLDVMAGDACPYCGACINPMLFPCMEQGCPVRGAADR